MRTPCVAGNWKMHKSPSESVALVREMLPDLDEVQGVQKVICPPFTSLSVLKDLVAGTSLELGAQNVYWQEEGAFTGEISPLMLAELVEHVIIGHSERRAYFGETDDSVNRRLLAALQHGLKPILCVGETLEENEAGKTAEVISRQIQGALAGVGIEDAEDVMIAYEPVWAIGTGKAATSQGANEVIAGIIRTEVGRILGGGYEREIRVLYGGSVKPHNAADFFNQPEIDGALVGGASLQAGSFLEIARAAI